MLLVTMWLVRSTRPLTGHCSLVGVDGHARMAQGIGSGDASNGSPRSRNVPGRRTRRRAVGVTSGDIVAGVRLGPAEPPAVAAMATSPGAASEALLRDAEADILHATPAEAAAATDAVEELESSDRVEDSRSLSAPRVTRHNLQHRTRNPTPTRKCPSTLRIRSIAQMPPVNLTASVSTRWARAGDDGPERDADEEPAPDEPEPERGGVRAGRRERGERQRSARHECAQ